MTATVVVPTAVVAHRDALPAEREQTAPLAIVELLRLAIEKNIPVEALERLQALHERVSDRQAASEFAHAMAAFQANCPPIAKNKKADIATRSGTNFQYTFADLPQIAKTIAPHLQAVGLAYTWDSKVADKQIVCACILQHVNGHKQVASFTCPVESGAGMSEQQKYAAALSFARRQSLVQVLGLCTVDPEAETMDPTPITAEQAADLAALCDECKVDRKRVLKWLKVERLEQVPAVRYADVVAAVREKAVAKGGAR